MLVKLAKQVVDWQIRKEYLPKEERALYEYAYEALLNQVLNISIAILIALWMHAALPVFVFLVSYIPLRSYCGGYHARTHGGCTILSTLLILGVCMLEKAITEGSFIGLHYTTRDIFDMIVMMAIVFGISGSIIFRFAPVADSNKPLDEEETVHYRRQGKVLWLIETCVGLLLCIWFRRAALIVGISHLVLSIILCLGIIKQRIEK